ncbi:MAG TPA: helix-turn-helix transcriptional regulator [Chthoniobacter sp.]|jgi:transcriptional regulator with XRE-family HTH domain
MNEPFSTQLYRLRTNAKLTNAQLAERADVPESLISGLQNDNRRVGEYQANKIGTALNLHGEQLEQFVLRAIDTSTEKVLKEAREYPAELLNLIAKQLKRAGICAPAIQNFNIEGDESEQHVTLSLDGGRHATLRMQLVCA